MSALDPLIFHPLFMYPMILAGFSILAYLAGVATAAWWFRHGRHDEKEPRYSLHFHADHRSDPHSGR